MRRLAAFAVVALVVACGGGGGGGGDSARTAPAYALGGTVSGMDEGYVDVRNGLDVKRVHAAPDGGQIANFTFDSPLPAGAGYDVQIVNDPQVQFGLQCVLEGASGTMPSRAVTSVSVRCARVRSVRFLAGVMTPVFGQDGLATEVPLNGPRALATGDLGGDLYVAEHAAIRRISPNGETSIVTSLAEPTVALAVNMVGALYSVEGFSINVKWASNTSSSRAAGDPAIAGHVDGPGSSARFFRIRGIAIGPAQRLYVIDTNGPGQSYLRIVEGGGLSEVRTVGAAIPGPALMGLAIDRPNATAYSCQKEAPNPTTSVVRISPDGAVTTIGTFAASTNAPCAAMLFDGERLTMSDGDLVHSMSLTGATESASGFGNAVGLSFWSGGLVVTNAAERTILRVSPAGVRSRIAGLPNGNGTGSTDGIGAAASFRQPRGLAVDRTGNVYVADAGNRLVRRITPEGAVTTLAGSAADAPEHVDGTGAQARFLSVMYLTTDDAGTVYVADSIGRTIRRITPTGEVSTLAGHPSRPVASFDGDATSATFTAPSGIAYGGDGTLYVIDGPLVRTVSLTGAVRTLPNLQVVGPAITVDRRGTLYVQSAGGIVSMDLAGRSFTSPIGAGVAPALAAGADLELYAPDLSNSLVHRLTSGGTGLESSVEAGTTGSTGMATGPLPGTIGRPVGIATTERRVYFTTDNAVLFFDRRSTRVF